MSTLRVDHVALPISDAAATYHFYTEILGLPLVQALSGDDWAGKSWLMMIFSAGDGRQLALIALRGEKADQRADDLRHYAFSVDTQAQQNEWKNRLRSHGVEFTEEDHGDQQSIYFKDPNGVVLEITTPPSTATPTHDAAKIVKKWLRR